MIAADAPTRLAFRRIVVVAPLAAVLVPLVLALATTIPRLRQDGEVLSLAFA